MKTNHLRFGMALTGCALSLALPGQAAAEVSTEDFNALKAAVQQLSEQVQSLRATNQIEQQLHAQDVQVIQSLQSKLAATQQTATDAEQTSIAASQAASQAHSQPLARAPIDEATVNHNFQILGDAEFQYVKADGLNGSFLLADFAPIFLYRGGDNILFEAGFDTTIANTDGGGYSTTFNLSFAQLDYVLNDYITFCAGDLILPLGTYTERGAGWLNKIPDNPLAVDALIPGTGVGAQLRGAVPIGDAGKFINYSIYGVNGPSSTDGTGNAGSLDLGGNVGLRSDGATANLHQNPSGGGRLGFFVPFKPHYDLEVGVSGQFGEWDNAGNHLYTAGVLDAALHLGANFEAKGEYIVDRYGSDEQGLITQNGWFGQVSYKLAGLDLELPGINNLELLGRYDMVHDGMGTRIERYTLGYVYYITNTLLFEGDYEILSSNDPSQSNQLFSQVSYGF